MPIETQEQIQDLKDAAAFLYAGLNTDVVIVSPIDRATGEKSHWVFDESFITLEESGEFVNYWLSANHTHRYGRLTEGGVKLLWKWSHKCRLQCAEVVFAYPDPPLLPF